jgi:hypothetical protein
VVAIRASIQTEKGSDSRGHSRRTLRLAADTWSLAGKSSSGTIYDVSRSGMLVDCELDLPVGDNLSVELPYAGRVTAKVVWREGSITGCEFEKPISMAAVSACLLRAEPELPGPPAYLKDIANALEKINRPQPVGTLETLFALGVLVVAVAILLAGLKLL